MVKIQSFIKKLKEIMMDENVWINISGVLLKVIFIIILATVVVKIGKVVIRKVFYVRMKSPIQYSERRETTLLKLLQNILAYVVYFSAILAILSAFSIEVGGLLAGAGIVGLAIGFGAQNLVKDIITGFFIIFEDQFSVGDYVRIGTAEGKVEEIGLRVTKIKGLNGETHIFPNGTIVEVVNFSVSNSVAVIDISISNDANIEDVEDVVRKYLQTVVQKYDFVVKEPTLLGVQNITATETVLRITAETAPLQHWAATRTIRKDLKILLDEEGIQLPYPKMIMMDKK